VIYEPLQEEIQDQLQAQAGFQACPPEKNLACYCLGNNPLLHRYFSAHPGRHHALALVKGPALGLVSFFSNGRFPRRAKNQLSDHKRAKVVRLHHFTDPFGHGAAAKRHATQTRPYQTSARNRSFRKSLRPVFLLT
jgi:hypothetical protein